MITPSYVRTMAAYNAAMNRGLYAAASRLPESVRRQARGAFWGSIHGTLGHLLWGDAVWLARFGAWPKPEETLAESAGAAIGFETLAARRSAVDRGIIDWAGRVDAAWLAGEVAWTSGATGQEMRRARGFVVTHFFNHQTHHRGQAHALITASGEATGDTDLIFLLDGPR